MFVDILKELERTPWLWEDIKTELSPILDKDSVRAQQGIYSHILGLHPTLHAKYLSENPKRVSEAIHFFSWLNRFFPRPPSH